MSTAGPAGRQVRTANWLCVRDGRLLHVRTRGRDAFYLPGGKIDPGEDAAAAVLREVEEEVGLRLDASSLRRALVLTAPAHGRPGTRVHMTCFTAEPLEAREPEPRREIAEIRWVDPADPPACAPASRRMLARLAAGEPPFGG